MTAKENENIKEKLEKLAQAIGSDESLVENVMSHIDAISVGKSSKTKNLRNKLLTRRLTMNHFTKLAAAAAIIIAVVLAITILDKSVTPAYAIEQTIEALRKIRFFHVIRRDDSEQIVYESWTELNSDGKQIRFRQNSPPDFLVIEDGQTVAAYHKDKKAIVFYDPKDKQYTMGDVSRFLENLSEEGIIIDENVEYRDKLTHRVRWLMANQDVFVDPKSKLPIAGCGYEISYDMPAEEIFEIVIPNGFTVIDKRTQATLGDEPDWFKEYESAEKSFYEGIQKMHEGKYEDATTLLEHTVKHHPRNNWAWAWLGKAHYELGEYDLAIYDFSKVIDMLGSQPYCHYGRGIAYAQKGIDNAADEDLRKALPWMILALRHTKAGTFFEWSDGPYYNSTDQQILARMVNRLRTITGQDFGYNPNGRAEENEQAIAAWEQWYEDSGQIKFTPDAELVDIPV